MQQSSNSTLGLLMTLCVSSQLMVLSEEGATYVTSTSTADTATAMTTTTIDTTTTTVFLFN